MKRISAATLVLTLAACGHGGTQRPTNSTPTPGNPTTLGRAELRPVGGEDVSGTVVVREQADGTVHLKGRIRGLEPHSSHTVLLNPEGQCGVETEEHLAYLGTVTADENGVASLSVAKEQLSLGRPAELIGSSLIVRESATESLRSQGGPDEEMTSDETQPMDNPRARTPAEPDDFEPGELERSPGELDLEPDTEACAVIIPEPRG
jgi:hypothetical protein